MRLVLLGPPGAGKGTQSSLICNRFSIPQISTGDILRSVSREASPLGLEIRSIMQQGFLVPDNLVIEIVKERIGHPDCRSGYLLDGIPRTLAQGKALAQAGVNLDIVIEFIIPDAVIVERLSGRLIHLPSGRTYHTLYHPPRIPNTDDQTGEPLVQREDDSKETVLKRLAVYHEHNRHLVQFYQDCYRQNRSPLFFSIDGLGQVDLVFRNIVAVLETAFSF